MIERLASLCFFLVVTTFNHHAVSGDNSTNSSTDFQEKSFTVKTRPDECDDCIRRVETYFSITVKDPKQFCIDNELCPESPAPSSQPTETSSSEPSARPSSFPSIVPSSEPSSRPSSAPSDGPSFRPSTVPTLEPSLPPSVGPSLLPSIGPTLEPSSLPSDGPSFLPSTAPTLELSAFPSYSPSLLPSIGPTLEPSVMPSDGPSLLPSTLPTLESSMMPSDGPSLRSSKAPTNTPTVDPSTKPSVVFSNTPSWSSEPSLSPHNVPSVMPSTVSRGETLTLLSAMPTFDGMSSRFESAKFDAIAVTTDHSIIIPSVSPTVRPTTMTPITNPSIYPRPTTIIFPRDFSTDTPSHPPTLHQSLPADTTDIESTPTTTGSWRTTVSLILLKNITSSMGPEVTQIFSATALQFLGDYSSLIGIAGTVNFVDVEVLGQGPEFGNSTKFDTHIDGMHVYFETIIAVEDNYDVDLPQLIEKIFKTNKNDFYFRLAESSKFFVPLDVENRISRGNVSKSESQIVSTSEFMNSWVLASLAIVLCSVFITIILMTRMIQGNNRHRILHEDTSKSDRHLLYSLHQTSSEDSDEMRKRINNKRRTRIDKKRITDKTTHVHGGDDTVDILMNLDSGSLAGLKLLRAEENSSLAYSAGDIVRKKGQKWKENELRTETDSDQVGNTKEKEWPIQPGRNARMKKQKIEQEGTSLETILKATSSFNTEEDGDYQSEGVPSVEIVSGDHENHSEGVSQKTSIVKRVTNFLQGKKKKKQGPRHLEPVRILEEGESILSCPSTPAHSLDNRNIFPKENICGRSNEGKTLSIDTEIVTEEEYNHPTTVTSAFSPVIFSPKSQLTVDTRRQKKTHPDSIKTTFISSPISRRLLRSRARPENDNSFTHQNHYYDD